MIEQFNRRAKRNEALLVLAACSLASLTAQSWSWRHGAMLNYGDAVAHLHIARRVFDSHRPGLTQLGSVWLPLPHLLILPFVAVYAWWANGIAGAIPSAMAYLAGCLGIYRLARLWLGVVSSALALAFFALNPNLLYLQTTAMSEPLFLCEMIWTVVWLAEWRSRLDDDPPRAQQLLKWIALALVAAVFTRYDGWVMALLAWVGVGLVLARRGKLRSPVFWIASAAVVAAPILWLAYNQIVFYDWLDFMRGPYSARAIEIRTAAPGGPPHPGWHNAWVSLLFFLKAAIMSAAAESFGTATLAVSLLGAAFAALVARRSTLAWTLLLWLPVPFYAYSVAFGSVPIFLPPWWPHSWYNTRYGLELLPALALFVGFAGQAVYGAVQRYQPRWTGLAAAALFAALAANALKMLLERPLVYVEGIKNIEARRQYEIEIPQAMRDLLAGRPGGSVLMDTSVFPQIVAFTGIPLRQTINESDKEFYRAALVAPASHAALILAFDGDDIDRAVHAHPRHLTAVRRFSATGQPSATLYVSTPPPSTSQPAR